jgi:hypothetical protein
MRMHSRANAGRLMGSVPDPRRSAHRAVALAAAPVLVGYLACAGCGVSKEAQFASGDDSGGGGPGDDATGGGGGGGGGSSSGGSGGSGLHLGDGSTGVRACSEDSDCNGSNPCVTYVCPPATGEVVVRTCVFASMSDAGSCHDAGAPSVDAGMQGLAPIDPACTAGGLLLPVFPPATPLLPPDVPASCHNGFEIGDATIGSSYTLMSKTPKGAAAITLDVDFATYLQADGVVVTGVGPAGTYTLLDTCRLQTSTMGDPTGGTSRPPDDTIRQFRIAVEQGTTELTFDFAGVVSPMYIQVLGLCDFDVTQDTAATWWQAVP